MKPIQFPEANVVFAKDQPEYQPLPAHRIGDSMGTVVTCWELSDEEIETIVRTKKMWLSVYSFNKPLVPLLLTVNRSDIYTDPEQPTMTETEIEKK